jgi:hypothetical protein
MGFVMALFRSLCACHGRTHIAAVSMVAITIAPLHNNTLFFVSWNASHGRLLLTRTRKVRNNCRGRSFRNVAECKTTASIGCHNSLFGVALGRDLIGFAGTGLGQSKTAITILRRAAHLPPV